MGRNHFAGQQNDIVDGRNDIVDRQNNIADGRHDFVGLLKYFFLGYRTPGEYKTGFYFYTLMALLPLMIVMGCKNR